ncbi:acyl-ACP--UDP-N-acetylglucosamine O-acyltransferase [Verrucomicrobiota bacterium]
MSAQIHSTAIINDGAVIGENVKIGPYCVIGSDVTIGDGTELYSHVVVDGYTFIGNDCKLHPFARIGGQTQDLKFKGGKPGVKVGDRTVIREYVTVNAATNDGEFTTVGSDCLIMAYCHVAHCCQVGNRVIMANLAQLSGHVVVEDMATIEGSVGVVQFCRVGTMAFIGGGSLIRKDVPPYMIGVGSPLEIRSTNKIGMERRGVSEESRKQLKEAFRLLYRKELSVTQALEQIESTLDQTEEVKHLVEFIKNSQTGITR